MNERIKKLAVQSEVYVEDDIMFADLLNQRTKNFAELIILECISALDDADGCVHHRECLLEHFGVKS